jgi:hypothetical protein
MEMLGVRFTLGSSKSTVFLYVDPGYLFDMQMILQEFPKSKLRDNIIVGLGTLIEVNCDYPTLYAKVMQYLNQNNWQPFTVDSGIYYFVRQKP